MYLMKNVEQYAPQFFPVKNPPMRWAQKTMIEKAPIWCSAVSYTHLTLPTTPYV